MLLQQLVGRSRPCVIAVCDHFVGEFNLPFVQESWAHSTVAAKDGNPKATRGRRADDRFYSIDLLP